MDDLKAILIFLAICVPFFIGTIWAVTDVAQKDFGTGKSKAVWWVVASIPFVGFIVYLLTGFRKGKKAD
jgi:Phospholipase_D-nuclease N-terminal